MTKIHHRVLLSAVSAALVAGCSSGGSTPEPTPSATVTPSGSATSTPSSAATTPATPASYTSPPATLPVIHVPLTTAPPPWQPPALAADNGVVSPRYIAAAGLPYAEEMLEVHYHAHLDITINGTAVTVPAYLGFVVSGGTVKGLAPLHTHDDSGVIHIENSVPAKFLLGQVFVEWGVRFTSDCIAGYCADGKHELAVFVNGTRYDGDPTRLVLASHQEIAIEYGRSGTLPPPPASYDFPSGE